MDIASIVEQLSPNNKQLAINLISQLAAQDGLKVSLTSEYKAPHANLKLWVANLKSEGKSQNTIDLYVRLCRNILKRLPMPTFLELQSYFAERLNNGISSSHVGSEQKAMKSLFAFLHHIGLYPSDPTKDIKLIREQQKEVVMPSDKQVDAVLTYTPRRERDRLKYKTMLILIVGTGLRITEACSLERRFIDWQNREIKVLGKGNKERTVPLVTTVYDILWDYMEATKDSKSKYVFPDHQDNGYTFTDALRKTMIIACKEAEVPAIHPHQLRHYFATKTLEHGAKLEVISKILGHSSVSITAGTYRHIKQQEYHSEIEMHDPFVQRPLALPGATIEGVVRELPAGSKEER